MQWTVKCSKVNNGCDKLCASCTTRYLRGMNGLRWVILAIEMSSQTTWITRLSCTMILEVGHVTLSDNRWGPSPMIDGVQDGEYAGQGSVWTAFDLRSPARGRMKKERHYTITKWSLAARHCLFIMGPRYGRWARSVNCLRWLRMVCVDFFGRYDVLLSCNSSCGWSSLIP